MPQSSAFLTFTQAYNLLSGDIAQIEISTDGGKNFTLLPGQKFTGTWNAATHFESMNIDLSNFIGLSNLQIRFHFIGTSGLGVWAIDVFSTPGSGLITSYVWTGPNIIPVTAPSVTVTPTERGTFTYHVNTTIGGCPGGTAPVDVQALAPPAFPAGTEPRTSAVCVGSSATFSGQPTGDNVVFAWQKSSDGVNWAPVTSGGELYYFECF